MRIIFSNLMIILCFCSSAFAQNTSKLHDQYQERLFGQDVVKLNLASGSDKEVKRINLSDFYNNYELLEKDEMAVQNIVSVQPAILDITIQGQKTIGLRLYKQDVRAEGFVVRSSSGETLSPNVNDVYYRGYVDGYPNSLAVLSVMGAEFRILYSHGSGDHWIHSTHDNLYIHYNDNDYLLPSPGTCRTDDEAHMVNKIEPSVETEALGSCVHMYIECDNDAYVKNGSSVSGTASWANATANEVITLYDNDGMTVYVSEVKVWDTVDPYASETSTGGMLTAFADEIQNDYNGRLAHLFSTRGLGGGIAWVGVLCSEYNASSSSGPYAVSASMSSANPPTVPTFSWNVEVVAHEMGHNWGSPHTHACNWNGTNTRIDNCGGSAGYPEGSCPTSGDPPLPTSGTIMSYCHLVGGIGIDFNLGFHDGTPAGTGPLTLLTNAYNNATCYTGGDCGTGTASCSDGIQNFGETDVDCGGELCPDCIVVNDDCDGAQDVTSRINAGAGIPAANGSNSSATAGTPTPASSPYGTGCNTYMSWCNNTNHNDIWFKLTIPAGSEPQGLLTVSTLGTSWDTQLAIWEGGCSGVGVPPTTFLSANDDYHGGGANNWNSKTTVTVIPGQEYFIQVDGYSNTQNGDVNLTIEYYPITSVTSQSNDVVFADWEGRDASGWTHYYNTSSNTLLLSVNKDDQDIGWVGIAATSCQVIANTGASNLGSNGCGAPYIENQPNWAVSHRTWDLNPSSQPGSPVEIRAYYSTGDLTDMQALVGTASHATLTHYKVSTGGDEDLTAAGNNCHQTVSSADYTEFDPGSYTYGTYASDHYGQYTVPSFSGGGIGTGGGAQGALPIILTTFEGEVMERHNRLKWTTSSELNNEWMVIQKSIDGAGDWEEVGRIEGNVLSTEIKNYQLDDLSPSSLTYYRLQSIDLDGKIGYSQVISLRRHNDLGQAEFSVYPVPSDMMVTIKYTGQIDGDMSYTVRDLSGKLVSTKVLSNNNLNGYIDLNIQDYQDGVYIITLQNKSFTEVLKFTKI